MISTGVVRKIDDLGRIVIPKEIRKSLGIRDGENLEIAIENNNIKLTKKNIINDINSVIEEILEVASKIITGSIIIADREKVIALSDNNIIKVNDLLSSKLINFLDERLSYSDKMLNEFVIGNNKLKGYFLILPIISEGNSIGLIIVYNNEKQVTDYYILIKYIALFLARKIDITC